MLLFRIIRSFKGLIGAALIIGFVILVLHRVLPQSMQLPQYFDDSTINSIAVTLTDFSFVKVAKDEDGNKVVYFKIDDDWINIQDFDSIIKKGSKYEVSFDGITSTDLTDEQITVLKKLFTP